MRDDLDWFDLQILAYRQAAHAVMLCELGRAVPLMTIDGPEPQTGDAILESLQNGQIHPVRRREAALRDCLHLLAGWGITAIIELRHEPRRGELERVRGLVGAVGIDRDAEAGSMEYLRHTAVRILREPRVFRRVRRVADALLKRGTITGDEVQRIVLASDAEGTDERPPTRWVRRRIVAPTSPLLQPVSDAPPQPGRAPAHERRQAPAPRRMHNHQTSGATWLPAPNSRQPADPGLATLRLSGRALGGLKRGGINTLDELVDRTVDELLDIRAVGAGIVNEILRALEATGLELRKPEDRPKWNR